MTESVGEASAEERRGRTVRILLAVAAVGAAALPAGLWAARPGGLLLLARVFDHPLLFGWVTAGALTAAALVGLRRTALRVLVGVLAGACALVAVPLSLLLVMFSLPWPETTLDRAAPERDDRRLVVEEGADMIDPVWWVSLDTGSGLGVRRWPLACFNGDDPADALTEAAWEGPHRLRLVSGEGEEARTQYVDVDPATGRPGPAEDRGAC
ncbi:hypothetical protein [Streptomyces sp. t39]|uniref:hypothetical protein n=1 Tax=Streptomyces sp. t39 TaxID=1828156 RepID=UPI0011CEBF24|nr:hypothetical protein [Streptomyces sp. t39]